ncbi:MAG: glycoside hydrolase family 3 N-terminal domain-containing protein [Bacteroidales bacterium]
MKIIFKKLFIVAAAFSFFLNTALGQNKYQTDSDSYKSVESILSQMTVREKLAQLFIVSFSSDTNDISTINAINEIKNERVGGVILMNSSLTPAVKMINYLQSISEIPLLVTIDGEWGAAMRFDSIVPFPRQMQLGALSDESLVYKMGYAIGKQAKRLGVDVNFAPTVDINNNPKNPVINTRSFGENSILVANYGIAYMRGMKDAGVPGSAKHFPGHGDTDVDSHKSLPLIPFGKKRLDSLELFPFKSLIESGVDMVMVAHLQIPSLDSSGRPASISRKIVSDLLRRDLEFGGLIVTDALNMKGVSDHFPAETLPLEAFKAGSDIILMPEKVPDALSVMERAVQSGEISLHSINMRCMKMLMLKKRLGILERREPVSTVNLYSDLNRGEYLSLISEISKGSVTLIKNEDSYLPYRSLKGEKIGYLSLGGDINGKEFAEFLSLYSKVDTAILRGKYSVSQVLNALNSLSGNTSFVIAMHNTDSRPQRDFGLNDKEIKVLTDFAANRKVTLVYFGNPLAIPFIKNLDRFKSVIVAYNNSLFNNITSGEIIFGVSGAKGRLPVSSGNYPFRYGLSSSELLRLQYDISDFSGYNTNIMADLPDSIIKRDIYDGLYTGAQLVVVHKNRVILNRAYGVLSRFDEVNINRMSALICELPAISILFSEKKVSPEDFSYKYLKSSKSSNKSKVLISDLLMQRGSKNVTDDYFPHFSYENVEQIRKITESITKTQLPEYINDKLYKALGMSNTRTVKKVLCTNANDIAKFLLMIQNGGSYGGVEVISKEAAMFTELFDQYYFDTLNGSMIRKDPTGDFFMIYLNNGAESNGKDSVKIDTGDKIRRLVERYFSNGNYDSF